MTARVINDSSSLRAGDLAAYMGLSRATIYKDIAAGYRWEFPRHRMSTPAHYKKWLRDAEPIATKKADPARLQQELCRLRSASDKEGARPRSHGSRISGLEPRLRRRKEQPVLST